MEAFLTEKTRIARPRATSVNMVRENNMRHIKGMSDQDQVGNMSQGRE